MTSCEYCVFCVEWLLSSAGLQGSLEDVALSGEQGEMTDYQSEATSDQDLVTASEGSLLEPFH